MDAGSSTSRASSVTRSPPPTPPLPQAGGLESGPSSGRASTSNPDSPGAPVRRNGNTKADTEVHSTSRRVLELPRRRSHRPPASTPGQQPDECSGSDTSPVRLRNSRKAFRTILSSSSQSSDQSEDETPRNAASSKAQNQAVPLPRLNGVSRNVRRIESRDLARTPPPRRSPSGSSRRAHSDGRSATASNPRRHAGSESEEELNVGPEASQSGHTEVIPKASFARGRRLLAPDDDDIPMATVLMRGEAHFIDQRRQ